MSLDDIISRAKDLLEVIEKRCSNPVLYSRDIKFYDVHIVNFVDNLMHVEVDNLREHDVKLFSRKKRVLGLMIHILQDVIIFRNTLKIKVYIDMFDEIVKKELSESMISPLITKINLLSSSINYSEKLRREKYLSEWKKSMAQSEAQADEFRRKIHNTSDEDMVTIISDAIFLDDDPKKIDDIKIMLRRLIYLRHLDNLCNQDSNSFSISILEKVYDRL